MSDLVAKLRLEASGGGQAAAEVGKVEDALRSVAPAGDAAGAGARKAANDIDHLGQVADATAMDLGTLYDAAQRDFVGIYQRQMAGVVRTQDAAEVSTRKLSLVGLGLSRQFADIAVTGAMGMNPLMILVQQGPQIADQLAVMKMEGLGLSQVMKGLAASTWAAVAPLAPFVAGAAAVAAVIGGTAALAARKLNQENKDLVASMGLTEKQLKRLKDQGVDTSITIGDVFRGTFDYLATAIGKALAPIGKWFSDLFDDITRWTLAAARNVIGSFVGAFEAVRATWRALPGAIGDVVITTANTVVDAVERMINAVIAKYNQLLPAIRSVLAVTGNVAGASALQPLRSVDLGGLPNQWEGQAGRVAADGGAAFKRGFEAGSDWADSVQKGIAASIVDAAKKRLLDKAGDADKGRTGRTPTDRSDQLTAQLDQAIAQASRAELQTRLSLSRDLEERAAIQKQIIAAELAEKTAALSAQAARIAADKGLDAAAKAELTGKLGLVQLIEEATAAAQTYAVDQERAAEATRQAYELRISERENLVDLLSSQADLMKSAFARNLVEGKILDAQNEIERLKLEEIIASAESTANEKAAARARLTVVEQIHANEKALLAEQTRLVDAIGEADDAVRGFKDAWRRHDWPGLLDNVERALQTIVAASQQFGPMGGLFAGGSAVAGLVGGKAGRAVSGGLGIAGLGLSTGTALVNAGSLGLLGGLSGGAMALGAVLGPVAVAAGVLYAAAKVFNLGGKPSNHGAGYDLVTGQISGDKRNDETVQAVTTAAQTIAQATQLLQSQGVTPGATVKGLVVGTRDPSQIYLSDGRTVTSAVGDAAAAVDTALREMLKGATYQSEAQKTLVENMAAAGKGFEDITAALESYAQAQDLVKGIDDAILKLTDPKAWALEELKRNQQAVRDALKAAADAGNLTAEEFARASGKLSTLEDLQLADTLKQFADAVDQSAEALKAQANDLAGSVSDRILELTDPVAAGVKRINDDINAKIAQAQPLIDAGVLGADFLGQLEQLRGLELDAYFANLADQVNDSAKAFQEARPRLLSWLDELRGGSAAELSPKAALAEALKQYERELAKAKGGDANALANITAYADRLIQADRNATSSATDRLALRSRVEGDIQGLADRGLVTDQANPASAIAALQAPLAEIAKASAAELATVTAQGKAVVIANLPSVQAMYGDVLAGQTDRLVAANDQNTRQLVTALQEMAANLAASLSALSGRLEDATGAQAQATAAQAAQFAEAVAELSAQQRLLDARLRVAR